MRYGLDISPVGAWGDPQTMAELARLAEDSGWDGVFVEDYVFFYDGGLATYDPWVTLTAMALATSQITLGTMVTPLARRRVWKLAAEAITLDQLSSGRMVLGVGLGDGDGKDFRAVGEPTTHRELAVAMDESLHVLDALWSGQPVTFHGEHVCIEDVTMPARPLQRPRIPIWVGGCANLDGPRRRALSWDGGCLYALPPPRWRDLTAEEIRALRRDARERRGDDSFVVAIGGRERGADEGHDAEYVTSIADAGADWWHEHVSPHTPLPDVRARISSGPIRART